MLMRSEMKSKQITPSYLMHRRNGWKLLILLPLLASSAMTAGCATRQIVKTDFCSPWRAIYVSRADTLTAGTATQIKAHDETGVKMGCWPEPKKAK